MVVLSSIGARFVVIAASATLHAGMFAAFAGAHAPARASDTTSLSVDVEMEPVPVVETPVPEVERPAVTAAAPAIAHTHTHPYPVPASHDAHPHDPSFVHAPSPNEAASPPETAMAPEVVVAPAAAAPVRFVMTFGNAAVAHGGITRGNGSAKGQNVGIEPGGGAPVPEAAVSVGAKLVRGVTPVYPIEARGEEIEAEVPLEIIVDTSGSVTDAHVTHHAGYGFDEAALNAIRSFRFSPAERDGHPVRVRMKWSVVFHLK